MKLEERALSRYLVKILQPLTEADPALLANYVVALLKNNKPKKELQKLCVDKLCDFLGTNSFVTKLFHALQDGSIATSFEQIEGTQLNEVPKTVISGGLTELISSSPQPEILPSATVSVFSEFKEKEISDDDDDDRNHKHRRRVTRSQSFDRDGEGDDERRPNKKHTRHLDNRQSLQESELQFSDRGREYTPSHTDRESSVKSDSRRHGSSPSFRLNVDGRQKVAKGSQTYCNEAASRFNGQNLFTHAGLGRGRGRNTVAWAPHDSRFTSFETVVFETAMPQGTTSTNLYSGTGRAISNTVNSSWNAYGMITGIPSSGLEQLHSLHAGIQGGQGPPLNATIGIGMGMGHLWCRDFEERGFCLRGDMCPMEHGLNRIVVEDVQSLSQFNLPVSLPSGHLLGMKSGAVGGHSSGNVSTFEPSNKSSYSKKYRVKEDTAQLNGMPIAPAENEPDFYDPDQPLWNKDCPDSSHGLMRLSSPGKGEEDQFWDNNSSDRHSCRLSDGDNERLSKSIHTTIGSHNVVPSIWGRVGPLGPAGNKSEVNRKGDASREAVQHGKQYQKEVYGEQYSYGRGSIRQGDCDFEMERYEDTGSKGANIPSQQGKVDRSVTHGLHGESGSHLSSGVITHGNVSHGSHWKGSEKSVRTLFVNCIPFQNNNRELLLSHFQKFGEVLDIHIPKNSARAFVQFCHRESAEAAIASPDAVMGNRFIRLSWANRDNILAGGESSAPTFPLGRTPSGVTFIAQPQKILTENGKEKVYDVAPAVSVISSLEAPPTETCPLKSVTTNNFSTPSISKVQKKHEKLELLEALRQKQELLAQKRDSFRRQLDKLEKQGTVCKHDVLDTDQGRQRQKTDLIAEYAHVNKSSNTDLHSSAIPDPGLGGENLVVMGSCEPVPSHQAGPSLLSPATLSQPSPKAFKPPFPHFSRLLATPPVFSPNRFKLDNRPTAFNILPPLPAGLMDISALKEHFVAFGDLCSVEFDNVEGDVDEASKTEKCSMRIIYTTRRAAERAFTLGKSWQGQNLQFAWIAPSNNTFGHPNVDNAYCQTSKGFINESIASEKGARVGASGLEKEYSGIAVQVEQEISDRKGVIANEPRNADGVTNLNDGRSDPAQCLTQSQGNTGAARLDTSSFAKTDISNEVLY